MGTCSYGLWLNQKGKTLADSFVLRVDEQEYLVISSLATNDLLRNRLESYLIADEVEIEDRTGQMHAFVMWGAGAREAAESVFGAVPAAGQFAHTKAGIVFRGRYSAKENFICVSDRAAASLMIELESIGAKLVNNNELAAERIVSGRPAVPTDIGPEDLPNEGGLDEVAISYSKGCYLGQEVMARLKNLGQVRRRLLSVAGSGEAPAPRSAILQAGKPVGQTRSSAHTPEGFVAMAMISLVNYDASAPVVLEDGRELKVRHE